MRTCQIILFTNIVLYRMIITVSILNNPQNVRLKFNKRKCRDWSNDLAEKL